MLKSDKAEVERLKTLYPRLTNDLWLGNSLF